MDIVKKRKMIVSSASKMVKGYKYAIYPTDEQKDLLNRTFGCCRYVYNKLLGEAIDDYNSYIEACKTNTNAIRPSVNGYSFTLRITSLKREPESLWLAEVSNVALQQSALALGVAFTNFFRNLKLGKVGYPRFKKKGNRQSFRLTREHFKIVDGELHIAKCKTPIKVAWSRDLPSEPSSITISKTPSGEYFVSFVCEYTPTPTNGTGTVGIDRGITHLAVLSDGTRIENPRHYVKAQKQLRRAQQSLSRKKKGSNNYHKQRIKVAKAHRRIANARTDHLHKLSRTLVNENQVIGLEMLNVKGMVKNRRLSKHISDVGWSTLQNFITYKVVESQHSTLVLMGAFYPSSHICAVTGRRLDRKLKLSERHWNCPACGQRHDRDVNAAQNIAIEAALVAAKYLNTSIAGRILLADSNIGLRNVF